MELIKVGKDIVFTDGKQDKNQFITKVKQQLPINFGVEKVLYGYRDMEATTLVPAHLTHKNATIEITFCWLWHDNL